MWFRRTASVSLAWSLFVILWGAYVRASGSGAGCGAHWPVCNGDLIPRAPSVQTLIEYTHRATSGIALLLVIAVFVMSLRQPLRSARRFAILSLVLWVPSLFLLLFANRLTRGGYLTAGFGV